MSSKNGSISTGSSTAPRAACRARLVACARMGTSTPRRPRAPGRKLLDKVRLAVLDLQHPRHDDRPPVSLFHDLAIRFGQKLAAPLAWLAARDEDARVHQGAFLLLVVAAKDPNIAQGVRHRFLAKVLPQLLAVFHEPSVTDDRKIALLPLVELSGGSTAELRGCFRDFDGAAAKVARDHAGVIEDTPQAVERLLETAGLVNHDQAAEVTAERAGQALVLGAQLAQHNGPVGAAALVVAAAIAHEHGVMARESPKALELAARLGGGRAAWYLDELGRWPGALGEDARRFAAELRDAGVQPRPPAVGAFSHAVALGTDGVGSRGLTVLVKTGDGAMHALSLLLNDEVGIKDAFPTWEHGAEVEEGLRATDLTRAPCDLAFARRLVADALHRHERSGRPVPGRFLLCRSFLGHEPLVPAPHEPDLRPYLTETVVRGPTIAEGSEALMEHRLYQQLWCASGAAYEFVRQPRRRPVGAEGWESLLDEFIASVALQEKDVLVRRLAMNLEIEALAGRAKKHVNRVAARTWVALTEGVVPFEKIPYVRALADHSMRAISSSLRSGFGSQREVNERSLERDRALGRMCDEIELSGLSRL